MGDDRSKGFSFLALIFQGVSPFFSRLFSTSPSYSEKISGFPFLTLSRVLAKNKDRVHGCSQTGVSPSPRNGALLVKHIFRWMTYFHEAISLR